MAKKKDKKKSKLAALIAPKVKKLELLYMAEKEITVKDLEQALTSDTNEETHIWPEIGIMEITLKSSGVVDVETMNGFMDDEEDLAFMKEHHIVSVYALTVEEPYLEEMRRCVAEWIATFGGFLCTDSDDFMPIYK